MFANGRTATDRSVRREAGDGVYNDLSAVATPAPLEIRASGSFSRRRSTVWLTAAGTSGLVVVTVGGV